MNKSKKTKAQYRFRRRARIRARVIGTGTCPRLAVFRSLRGMNVQLINDEEQKTLASVNSKKDAATIAKSEYTGNVAVAFTLGKAIAEKAKAGGITSVVFDRGGYAYHGRIKAVADGARDGGLVF